MPRSTSFSRDEIGGAAVDLVREQGWEALTARGVAARLGVSVAPVYGAFASMEELQGWVLEEAARRLAAGGEVRQAPGGAFLNRGVGLIVFARDEPRLFLALYRAGGEGGALDRYLKSIRERLPEEEWLAGLSPGQLDRIFEWLWTFTLGMVAAMLFGHAADRSTEGIVHRLRAAGSLVIYGVAAGIDEYDGPAVREAWKRLLEEAE